MFSDRPADLGGIETHMATLAKDLHHLRQIVTLAFPVVRRKGIFSHACKAGVRLIQVDRQGVGDVCRRTGVDIFHAHSHGAAQVGAALHKGMGLPHVVTLHGPGQLHLSNSGAFILAVSQEIAASMKDRCEDWHVIPNGVDLERFHPRKIGRKPSMGNESSTGSKSRRLRTVYLGRVGPTKQAGVHALEKALASRSDVSLEYVSNWSPSGRHRPHTKVEGILREADIVFSTGRGVREAMACGAVACVLGVYWDGLVTPNTVEKLEQYNFSGRLSRTPPTAKAISLVIRDLLNRPLLLSRLKKFSADYAKQHWNSRVLAKKTLSIYRGLINI